MKDVPGATGRRQTAMLATDGRLARLKAAVDEELVKLQDKESTLTAAFTDLSDPQKHLSCLAGASTIDEQVKQFGKDIVSFQSSVAKTTARIDKSTNAPAFEATRAELASMVHLVETARHLALMLLDRSPDMSSYLTAFDLAEAAGLKPSVTMCCLRWYFKACTSIMFGNYEEA